MNKNKPVTISLQALLLADHIYKDTVSGKYIIAGTFHQLNVPAFPATFGKTVGVFVSLCGVKGKTGINLEFLDTSTGKVLMHTQSLEISCDTTELSVDFAIEVPPLPLPHAGRYLFRLAADGNILGEVAVIAHSP